MTRDEEIARFREALTHYRKQMKSCAAAIRTIRVRLAELRLEKMKELNATTGKRNGDEDLGHWADREKRENMWVRDVALPDLLAVAEAAEVVKETYSAVMSDPVASDIDAEFGCLADAWNRLDAALAKLEAPHD